MGQEQDSTKGRKWKQISERERYEIEALLKAGHSIGEIAGQLKRDRRTIQREKARGQVKQRDSQWREVSVYAADVGERIHQERAGNKGRPVKIGHNHELAAYLEEAIVQQKFSPDAALGALRRSRRAGIATVCTKTIYNYIDMQLFAGITNEHLPVKRQHNTRRHRHIRTVALNNRHGKSIQERDETVELRQEEGHWEMDCVVGKPGTAACLLVMTERKHAVELIFKLESKTQDCVAGVLDELEERYGERFSQIFKTITVDNGSEFLDGERLERSRRSPSKSRTCVYYAHPYCAWERGSNENQNKLIRRFLPKGTDVGQLTGKDVERIQYWMNHYPRRRFGFQSPLERCTLGVA